VVNSIIPEGKLFQPRWTAYDVVRYKTEIRDDIKIIPQERAYTSPIWYTPEEMKNDK